MLEGRIEVIEKLINYWHWQHKQIAVLISLATISKWPTRSSPAAVSHQGILIIVGGNDDRNRVLSSTAILILTLTVNMQWYSYSNLPQPKHWLQSVIVNNTLYLLGGAAKIAHDSSAIFTASLNTLSNTSWNSTHIKILYIASLFLWVYMINIYLLTVGGCKMMGGHYTSDIYMLNKISHSWETLGNIPSARKSSAAVSTDDNRIVVIAWWREWQQRGYYYCMDWNMWTTILTELSWLHIH